MARIQQQQSVEKPTKAQVLLAQASEAAEIRSALTHPDVVALGVERVRRIGDRLLWISIGILLVFTVINVQHFVVYASEKGSLLRFGAWFMEPGLVAALIGVLIWESATTRQGIKNGRWIRTAKWGLLASTYAMNTWLSWTTLNKAGIVVHSIPPLVVFVLTEARAEMLIKLSEAVRRAHTYASDRMKYKIPDSYLDTTTPTQPPVVSIPDPLIGVDVNTQAISPNGHNADNTVRIINKSTKPSSYEKRRGRPSTALTHNQILEIEQRLLSGQEVRGTDIDVMTNDRNRNGARILKKIKERLIDEGRLPIDSTQSGN